MTPNFPCNNNYLFTTSLLRKLYNMDISSIRAAIRAAKVNATDKHQSIFDKRYTLIQALGVSDIMNAVLQKEIDILTKEIEALDTIIFDLATQLDVLDVEAAILKESGI